MKSQKQDTNRNSFDTIANRIRFVRKARGVTLGELSEGKPSTASSWEKGSNPRPDQWEGIAKKLNVSVSFLFLGHPKTPVDFDFVAKYRDEIGSHYPDQDHPKLNEVGVLHEDEQAPYGSAKEITAEIRRLIEDLIRFADHDPGRLGWIREQILRRLEIPEHWNIHERVMEQVIEEQKNAGPFRTRPQAPGKSVDDVG